MPSFLNMWRRKPIIQMDIPELGRAMSDEKSVDPEYQKKEVASDQRLQLNRREEYLKIPLSRVDDLLNLFGEQVILQSSLDHATESGKELDASYVRQTVSTLKKITQELQHNMVSLRMVPVRPLFNRMERVVRDVSRTTGKKAEFIRSGDEGEMDKNILDALVDPLTHMLRNAIDHGIESPEKRLAAGKPELGKVLLMAERNGGLFEIKVQDDGGGLDRDVILSKAKGLGLISQNEKKLSDEQIFSVIFESGFTTKKEATEVSGRGVGMDVVAQQIKALKGNCTVRSVKGKGTQFYIRLPLSLAMFNGTVVMVGGQRYVIPNSDFQEAIPLNKGTLLDRDGQGSVLRLGERVLSVIDLGEYLTIDGHTPSENRLAITMRHGKNEFALCVNQILSQEQIVLKQLGPEFKQVAFSSGGTVLGDGNVAVVLDLNSIIALAAENLSAAA